jgi:hypothetical protein
VLQIEQGWGRARRPCTEPQARGAARHGRTTAAVGGQSHRWRAKAV